MPLKRRSRSRGRSRVLRAPLPPTRDPFINTPLLRLTPDPRTGVDRFWISTCNFNAGCLGALITEHGEARVYRFGLPHACFYSAAQEDDDTLWLCGWTSYVARLTLSTGKLETFDTGAPGALTFQGMALDRASGKLFVAVFAPPKTFGFSFDIRRRRTAKVQELPTAGHYARVSFPNGDGTWSVVLALPGDHVVVWDPRNDRVEEVTVNPTMRVEDQVATTHALVSDERGRHYFPRVGWFNPATRRVEKGSRPEREMTWFARRGGEAIGVAVEGAQATVAAWELATGKVRNVVSVPDAFPMNFNLTSSGRLVAVNLYGVFFRFDLDAGGLECSRVLPTESVGWDHCLCRVDERRVIGTPYITQRFWQADLKARTGSDLGRVAPGGGEVLKLAKVDGKVYLAAYHGGELMEYDPERPARFPDNPRVVADPPGGTRPVAIAAAPRQNLLWYACSHTYGTLGGVLTRYDTSTGLARYATNPLGDQQIQSLVHDRATGTLLCGSTVHADCQSRPPSERVGKLARLRDDDMKVINAVDAPAGSEWAGIVGPTGRGAWLGLCQPPGEDRRWFLVDDDLSVIGDPRPLPEGARQHVLFAARAGRFILNVSNRIELWRFGLRGARREHVLHEGDELRLVAVDGNDVLFTTPTEVGLLEARLK